MQVGLNEAARITGKNKATIHRAAGKDLSFTLAPDGSRRFDIAELERVYPRETWPGSQSKAVVVSEVNADHEKEILQLKLDNAERMNAELRVDRDHWRDVAEVALRALPVPAATVDNLSNQGAEPKQRKFLGMFRRRATA